MKFFRSICIVFFPLYFFSCGIQQKVPNYIENITDTTGHEAVRVQELRIQKNDLLAIQVYSASSRPEISDVLYNLPPVTGGTGQADPITGGFLVDANGNIEYPRIGVIKAEGLTKEQLATIIKRKINEKDTVLINPTVIIRFRNLKVTVLGEVNNQGVLSLPGERLTIMEAIGLAGGINEFGLKESVKVIREIDGKREIGMVDLSARDVFSSPYYNLMQNDIVVVDPVKRKAKKASQDVAIQRGTFVLSIITAFALVYNVISR